MNLFSVNSLKKSILKLNVTLLTLNIIWREYYLNHQLTKMSMDESTEASFKSLQIDVEDTPSNILWQILSYRMQ